MSAMSLPPQNSAIPPAPCRSLEHHGRPRPPGAVPVAPSQLPRLCLPERDDGALQRPPGAGADRHGLQVRAGFIPATFDPVT